MATTKVTAKGPIEFTDGGKQIVLPLSAVAIDNTGKLTSQSPLYTGAKNKAAVDAWFKELLATGFVRPAPVPPPQTAMVVTAKTPGSMGNNITLTFVVNQDGTFNMTVAAVNTWNGLTAATIKAVVGTQPGGGTRPGLVYVSSAPAPATPDVTVPVGLGGNGPYTKDINTKNATLAFTLEGAQNTAGGDKTTVEVKNVQDPTDPASTFTLEAKWPVPGPVTAANKTTAYLQNPNQVAADFGFVIDVAAGPTGLFLVPAAGTVQLRGGSDGPQATKASANVPANG